MHQDFVSLAAHPLIDIDLTVVIQFALFLILTYQFQRIMGFAPEA